MNNIDTIKKYSNETDTDISSHLVNMYTNTYEMKPSIIVECGVSTGESSKIFSFVNQESKVLRCLHQHKLHLVYQLCSSN